MAAPNKTADISINIADTVISSTDLKSVSNSLSNNIKYVKIKQVLAKLWAIQFYTFCPIPCPSAQPLTQTPLAKKVPT